MNAPNESAADQPARKYHHFLPGLLLRHFADAKGLVHAYDRARGFAFQNLPTRLGGEKYLYSPLTGSDPKDDSLEIELADKIDGPAAEPVERILSGQSLSSEQRSAVAAFLGMLDMRTPAMRDFLVPAFEREGRKAMADFEAIRRALAEEGESVTVEEIAELHALHVDNLIAQVAKPAWLDYLMKTVNLAGSRIFFMKWMRIDAVAGVEFLTSDLGVVKFASNLQSPMPHGFGFAAGRTHWVIPLSSAVALAITPDGKDGARYEASEDWLARVNRQCITDASRFVYSRSRVDVATLAQATPKD